MNECRIDLLPCIASKLLRRDYVGADRISRSVAYRVFIKHTSLIDDESLWRIVDSITGGLGYEEDYIDESRVIQAGCYIAWADAVHEGFRVLEIGTGLGRTLYCILSSSRPREYITIDNSPHILSIALYRNPFKYFQDMLWSECVRVVLGDAITIVRILVNLGESFDHIVHDGGPNPRRNPRLFSEGFIKALVSLLKPGGTVSVFAGKDRLYISKIYGLLKDMGLEAWTDTYPGLPFRVVKARKRHKTL